MKIIRVGDPHVKPSNIDESEALIEFVAEHALKEKVDRIEILGDLFHTHSILRLEVLEFWTWAFELLTDICEVVVLVGNHDQSGDLNSDSSSLNIYSRLRNKKLTIVSLPMTMGVFGYMPYIHDANKFVESANDLFKYGAKVLVCHQTFNGATYENGFYAPDGIDPEKIPFAQVISGHIHATQEFDKIFYPGTPRWDSASDANQTKGIWLFEHGADGSFVSKTCINTDKVCKPIVAFEWKEGSPAPEIPEGSRASVTLIGTSDWIAKQKVSLRGKVSISTKITDRAKLESRKTGMSLEEYIRNSYVTSMNKDDLLRLAKEMGLV